jgi:hypothetical protein
VRKVGIRVQGVGNPLRERSVFLAREVGNPLRERSVFLAREVGIRVQGVGIPCVRGRYSRHPPLCRSPIWISSRPVIPKSRCFAGFLRAVGYFAVEPTATSSARRSTTPCVRGRYSLASEAGIPCVRGRYSVFLPANALRHFLRYVQGTLSERSVFPRALSPLRLLARNRLRGSLPTRLSLPAGSTHHERDVTQRDPAHRPEAYSPKCQEGAFSELRV